MSQGNPNPKTAHLTPWKPGIGGGGKGRPALPPELKAIKSLSQLEVAKIVSKFGRMTAEQLNAAKNNPQTTTIEACVISIFAHSIAKGDYARLSILLDRAIGKTPAVEPALDEDQSELQRLQRMSVQDLVAIIQNDIPKQIEIAVDTAPEVQKTDVK